MIFYDCSMIYSFWDTVDIFCCILLFKFLAQQKITILCLFATDKKRPDGMTTFPYKGGKPLAWDFTVVDTVCPTYCHTSAEESCKTAEKAELQKIHKYRHLTDFHFIPIGAETLGPFGPRANINKLLPRSNTGLSNKKSLHWFSKRCSCRSAMTMTRGNWIQSQYF